MEFSVNNISQQFFAFIASNPTDVPEGAKKIFDLADEHFSTLLIPGHIQMPYELLGERVLPIWQWLKSKRPQPASRSARISFGSGRTGQPTSSAASAIRLWRGTG